LRTLDLPPISKKYSKTRGQDGFEDVKVGKYLTFRCGWLRGLREGPATSFHHGRIVHEITFKGGERWGKEEIKNEYGEVIYLANWAANSMSGYVHWFADNGSTQLMTIFYLGSVRKSVEYHNGGEREAMEKFGGFDLDAAYNFDMVKKLVTHIVVNTNAIVTPVTSPRGSFIVGNESAPSLTRQLSTSQLSATGSDSSTATTSSASKIRGLFRTTSSKNKQALRSSSGYQEATENHRKNSATADSVFSSSSSLNGVAEYLDVQSQLMPLILGSDAEDIVLVDNWGKEVEMPKKAAAAAAAADNVEDLINMSRKMADDAKKAKKKKPAKKSKKEKK
jgi:hypothetical protein